MSEEDTYKVVAVTGGRGGIGAAVVSRLLASGVGVLSLDTEHSTTRLVVPEPGKVAEYQFDVRELDEWPRLFETFMLADRPIVGLVNCAAVLTLGPVEDLTKTALRDVMSVNFESPVFASIALARNLISAGLQGSIVNISSIHAKLSEPAAGPYAAAKGALESMTRTMASEWARHGIRVNAVRPGAIRTPMSIPTYSPQVLTGLVGRIPLGRLGEPEDVAGAVAFLLSTEASYITGSVVTVDGGFSMHGGIPGVAYSYR